MSEQLSRRKKAVLQKFKNKSRFNIIFICSGNIIRSPYAHLLFEHMIKDDEVLREKIHIESGAVTYYNDSISGESRNELIKEGISLERINKFKPRHISKYPDMLRSADLILTMSKSHITRIPPIYCKKSFLLLAFTDGVPKNVPDPYFDPPYSRAFRMIKSSLINLYHILKAN